MTDITITLPDESLLQLLIAVIALAYTIYQEWRRKVDRGTLKPQKPKADLVTATIAADIARLERDLKGIIHAEIDKKKGAI